MYDSIYKKILENENQSIMTKAYTRLPGDEKDWEGLTVKWHKE